MSALAHKLEAPADEALGVRGEKTVASVGDGEAEVNSSAERLERTAAERGRRVERSPAGGWGLRAPSSSLSSPVPPIPPTPKRRPRLLGLVAAERPRQLLRHCVYCGTLCYGKACQNHKDLIQADPGMGAIPR
jgi:hypothetical protein